MSDYARIADAIRFIASQVERQPTLDEIAAHVHLVTVHRDGVDSTNSSGNG